MNLGILHSTLRELRLYLTTLHRLGGAAIVGVIAGLSGPFQTFESLTIGARVAYWVWVAVSTFALGSFGRLLVQNISPKSQLVSLIASSGLNAVLIVGYIFLINSVVAPSVGIPDHALLSFAAITAVIVVMITVGIDLFSRTDADQLASVSGPILVSKLPVSKRGEIISLTSEDHYVRIDTDKGSETLLFRLSDAIEMCATISGIRVHRSHWVAKSHVVDYAKDKDRWFLVLSNGQSVPISRKYREDAIEHGLIPARG